MRRLRTGRLGKHQGRRVEPGDTRSPMLRLLEQSGTDQVQVEYDQQWRTFFKALGMGFIKDDPGGGGILTEAGKQYIKSTKGK